jgi:hypothetical protein
MKDLLAVARANNLSSYDTSYLDLSMRRGLPIATLDTRLIKAAKKTDVSILKRVISGWALFNIPSSTVMLYWTTYELYLKRIGLVPHKPAIKSSCRYPILFRA